MKKSRKEQFKEAVKEADIFWDNWYEETEDGFYIIELELDSRLWIDSIDAVIELCDEWDGAYFETEKKLDLVRIKLRMD